MKPSSTQLDRPHEQGQQERELERDADMQQAAQQRPAQQPRRKRAKAQAENRVPRDHLSPGPPGLAKGRLIPSATFTASIALASAVTLIAISAVGKTAEGAFRRMAPLSVNPGDKTVRLHTVFGYSALRVPAVDAERWSRSSCARKAGHASSTDK